jgi:hypothetical protein
VSGTAPPEAPVLRLRFPDESGIFLYGSGEATLSRKPRDLDDPHPRRPADAEAWWEAHDVGGSKGLRPLFEAAREVESPEGGCVAWRMGEAPFPSPVEIAAGLRDWRERTAKAG